MKVDNNKINNSYNKKILNRNNSNQDFSKFLEDTTSIINSSEISLNPIFVKEDNEEEIQKRKKIKRYGLDIIELLDKIKIKLLSGNLSKNELENILSILNSSKEKTQDFNLMEIINQIELRAEVELAKYNM